MKTSVIFRTVTDFYFPRIADICFPRTDAPPLEGVGIFPAGLRLVSINITSANERPLILSSFSQEVFEAHKRVLVFDHARPFLLSHPSHQLQFELQAVDGNKVVVPKESLLLLGVALIQEK